MEYPPLPKSWSDLTWQQLCELWQAKMRYGGKPDVARVAALLGLLGLSGEYKAHKAYGAYMPYSPQTGERQYLLRSEDGSLYTVTPRELSQLAKKALPWFDWPYGDPGEKEERDENGKVIREEREAVKGYVTSVSDWHDALALPKKYIVVRSYHFALPEVACYNLTWEQYRTLQNIASNLFTEGMSDAETLNWQAQFLSHCLTPRSFALLDTTGSSVRLRPHWEYTYNSARAEGMVSFWQKQLENHRKIQNILNHPSRLSVDVLFNICFQVYQSAVAGYYATAYPMLFGGGKSDTLTDALKGETRTVNAVMKYAGYTEQQQVYDTNLPFVLDYLNAMTEEAKEIERINSKIKK